MGIREFFDDLNYNVNKKIDIFNFGIYSSNKIEKEIYKKSKEYIGKGIFSSFEDSYLRNFYYFQLLIELINRFQKEMNISDRSIKYLNISIQDLKLFFRFQMTGYYTTSGIHLRGFFEKLIHFIVYYYIDLGKIDEKIIKQSLKVKIDECLKIGELSIKNIENDGKDVYDKYYFPISEVLKLYSHYSYDFVHNGTDIIVEDFNEKRFKELNLLFKLTHIYTARFIKVTIGETIEKYWHNKVNKQIEDRPYYRNYLQSYFGENKFSTNQFSYIYNTIHDDKDNLRFAFKDLQLNKKEMFSKEYLDSIALSDRLRKKAKGNKEIYSQLYEEHYNNINNS